MEPIKKLRLMKLFRKTGLTSLDTEQDIIEELTKRGESFMTNFVLDLLDVLEVDEKIIAEMVYGDKQDELQKYIQDTLLNLFPQGQAN